MPKMQQIESAMGLNDRDVLGAQTLCDRRRLGDGDNLGARREAARREAL